MGSESDSEPTVSFRLSDGQFRAAWEMGGCLQSRHQDTLTCSYGVYSSPRDVEIELSVSCRDCRVPWTMRVPMKTFNYCGREMAYIVVSDDPATKSFSGEHPAREAAAALGAIRIGSARGRVVALAWIARCMEALASGEREAAEDALAEANMRAREAGKGGADAHVLVEVLGMLFDAARGQLPDVIAPATELERFAAEHGFTSFYWFDVLRSVLGRVDDSALRVPMQDALARVVLLLGPAGRLTRQRRTSAPPGSGP